MEKRTDISAYIDDLKKILTDLRATGDDGFEGLIKTALSEIAGVPFRLAGSGSPVPDWRTEPRRSLCHWGRRKRQIVACSPELALCRRETAYGRPESERISRHGGTK